MPELPVLGLPVLPDVGGLGKSALVIPTDVLNTEMKHLNEKLSVLNKTVGKAAMELKLPGLPGMAALPGLPVLPGMEGASVAGAAGGRRMEAPPSPKEETVRGQEKPEYTTVKDIEATTYLEK